MYKGTCFDFRIKVVKSQEKFYHTFLHQYVMLSDQVFVFTLQLFSFSGSVFFDFFPFRLQLLMTPDFH